MDSGNSYIRGMQELVAQAAGCDTTRSEDICALIDEHYEPLLRYLTLLSWNTSLSEEVVQETFLRLHHEIRQGTQIKSAKSWLFRVAHNIAIDQARLPRPEESLSDEEVSRRVEYQFRRIPSDPESLYLERERMERLHRAIQKLPAQQRHALYLRREGFRYHEIAGILRMGETTVIDHVRRAIVRLNQELHGATSL